MNSRSVYSLICARIMGNAGIRCRATDEIGEVVDHDGWVVVAHDGESVRTESQPAITMATMDDCNEQCHCQPHLARRCPEAQIMCRLM